VARWRNSLYACPFRPQVIWYFGTTDVNAFNFDASLLPIRLAASPAWMAALDVPPSAGHALNKFVPVLGIHSGDPTWTLASYFPPPVFSDCSTQLPSPLWRPTLDEHALLFGLLMEDVLKQIGSQVVDELVKPFNSPCSAWDGYVADYGLDFLCRSVGFVPGQDLSGTFAGTPAAEGPCKLAAYGSLAPTGNSTLWGRNLPQAQFAWLLFSLQANPKNYGFGILVPDIASLGILPIQSPDDCGHFAMGIPGGIWLGDVYVQLVLRSNNQWFLTNAFKLTFLP
jgi:hypothetical protein